MLMCIRTGLVLVLVVLLSACEPSDDRPGMWLDGEVAAFPENWSFTNDEREISMQVQTPYWLAHSVTIWCVEIEGSLYVGALSPETKMWPGWVMDSPDVKLKIAGKIYEANLVPVRDAQLKGYLAARYTQKYKTPPGSSFAGDPDAAFWRVEPAS